MGRFFARRDRPRYEDGVRRRFTDRRPDGQRSCAVIAIALAGLCSCAASRPEPALHASAVELETSARASEWAEATRSPWPASVDGRAAALTEACGTPDGALARVAEKLVAERARGYGAPDPDRVVSLLRAQGEPHVRPRIVSASSRGAHDDDAIRARLVDVRTPRSRCGVAIARQESDRGREGNELFVAVMIDAVADLDALPMRGRTGEWLEVSARLHVPASNAKLVVLGPRGVPRTVPTSLDSATGAQPTRRVRARFALDRPGEFTVQLIGDLASGPEPLLEARVFADVTPTGDDSTTPAPGEDAATEIDDETTALARMTATLRSSESLPALVRDPRLDELALAQAEQMKSARMVAHDLGDGDLALRFETAGLLARHVGENVARARSVALAHRALYASPSHRMNLLRSDYSHFGVGVVRDDSGDAWVCEVFAGGLE